MSKISLFLFKMFNSIILLVASRFFGIASMIQDWPTLTAINITATTHYSVIQNSVVV